MKLKIRRKYIIHKQCPGAPVVVVIGAALVVFVIGYLILK